MKNNIFWKLIWMTRKNSVVRNFVDVLAVWYYKLFRSGEYFIFEGIKFKYFYHIYNCTIANERAIELSLASQLIKKYRGKKILEVGNVLSHYFPVSHDVVDKYEIGRGVINCDINEFSSPYKYDLIISISTMEHVGIDYGENLESNKALEAIDYLKGLLKEEGQIFITIPFGYNRAIYDRVKRKSGLFEKEYFFKKVSSLNNWTQISRADALKSILFDKSSKNVLLLYVGTETKH